LHTYRTHTCSEITKKDSGKKVKLSGCTFTAATDAGSRKIIRKGK